MKKDRLARLQQAISILGDVMEELTPKVDSVSETADTAKVLVENDNLRKHLKEANARLEKARQKVTPPASIPVEKDGGGAPKPFSWPVDMNAPMGRDNVEKGDFFGKG